MDHYLPACHADLLNGIPIFEKLSGGYREIETKDPGRPCSTIGGDTVFIAWNWTGSTFGSQGHLHKKMYRNATDFRIYTTDEPCLWVKAGSRI